MTFGNYFRPLSVRFGRMNDDGRQYQGESEIDNLVKRFERMIEEEDQQYFDLEDSGNRSHYLSMGPIENAKKFFNALVPFPKT